MLIKSRMSVLLPTLPYGNVTLESEITHEVPQKYWENLEAIKNYQEDINGYVRQQIELQKDEVDKYTKEFFKVSV
jgi:hypothetical protein